MRRLLAAVISALMECRRRDFEHAIDEQHALKVEIAKLSNVVSALREELAVERGRSGEPPVLSPSRRLK